MPEDHKLSDTAIFKSLKSGSTEASEITYYKYSPKLFDYRRFVSPFFLFTTAPKWQIINCACQRSAHSLLLPNSEF